ncbi:MAG: sigma-54-dependent Fis family transcriptional regulator [Deltaproteobacteria bacterium]|nr:sigma-54-dependent Fis family transcriptional regulator [Deltaproteobacteria bacterium]
MKILVADSQKITRRILLSNLEKYPFTVLKASDAPGLGILLQQEADLLFLDVSLLDKNIFQALEKINLEQPQLRVVLLAYPEDLKNCEEELKNREIQILYKPFDEKQSNQLLENLLSEEGGEKKEEETSKYYDITTLPSVQRNPAMKKAVGFLLQVADSDITVLISGESGVGKEIYSRTLHRLSRRKNNSFVGINCASIPGNLLESELFGYERGAFTGAIAKRIGKFEMAQQGSLLLDEITEMDIQLQSKLLRVIQEKELYRVGGHQKIRLDVRLIATTNRDLKESVKNKAFREDLYYRLNVISVRIPSLRERPEDIPVLAEHILNRYNSEHQDRRLYFSPSAQKQLMQYPWPGNIRELENILIRSIYLSSGKTIENICFDEGDEGNGLEMRPEARFNEKSETSSSFEGFNVPVSSIKEIERQMIYKALEHFEGNRIKAASSLGVSVRTLRNKLKLYREEGHSLPDHLNLEENETNLENEEASSLNFGE